MWQKLDDRAFGKIRQDGFNCDRKPKSATPLCSSYPEFGDRDQRSNGEMRVSNLIKIESGVDRSGLTPYFG
ncbi:MAG: hypothetical protein D6680_11305 [Cyanobacteria bacterium J007]|nr:MAG: hypothetical protein D6680_11305 [Cyanobacteria bacterium J007]